MLHTNSDMFRWMCQAVEEASALQNVCINLNMMEACVCAGIIHKEGITGDFYTTRKELQEVASIYADFDAINY